MADFHDYAQDSNIQKINQATHELEAQTIGLEQRLSLAEKQIKRLMLLNEAMFSLLGEQLQLGDAELLARIEVVAETRTARREEKFLCSGCGRELVSLRKKCMYCGGELIGGPAPSPFVF